MTRLAYVEDCLPGETTAERLRFAERHALPLEVACRPELDVAAVAASGLEVVTVQAYGMHDWHPLHPDPAVHERARLHLVEAMELALRLGAPRVLAVCGFGQDVCDQPFESCRDFFRAVWPAARARGLRMVLEPLSPLRAGAMTEPAEFQRLMDELRESGEAEGLATALDTGHLADGGHDAAEVFRTWRHPVEEVQLRGAGSHPPEAGTDWGAALGELAEPPEVAVIEYRRPIPAAECSEMVARLRGQISA
ncbi:MAG: TIM barrel protein [Planctomycetota bacterium]